jgi:DNA segregation ATPase FtsK/SpoIIIE, S-DNA-T family
MSSAVKKSMPTPRRPSGSRRKKASPQAAKRRLFDFESRTLALRSLFYEVGYSSFCLCLGAFATFALIASLQEVFLYALYGPVSAERSSGILGLAGRQVGAALVSFCGASVIFLLGILAVVGVRGLGVSSRLNVDLRSFLINVPQWLASQIIVSTVSASWSGLVGGGTLGYYLAGLVTPSIGPLGATLAGSLVLFQLPVWKSIVRVVLNVSKIVGTWFYRAAASQTDRFALWKRLRILVVKTCLAPFLFFRSLGKLVWKVLAVPLSMVRRSSGSSKPSFVRETSSTKNSFCDSRPVIAYNEGKAAPLMKVTSEASSRRRKKTVVTDFSTRSDSGEYFPPSVEILAATEIKRGVVAHDNEKQTVAQVIKGTLEHFGVRGEVVESHTGPVITLHEFKPSAGVKVGKIASLQDDLAMRLAAQSVRIIAPLPGKGTVGIEVPHKNREVVTLRELLESPAYCDTDASLPVAIGKDSCGEPVILDIAAMPHLLIAGATGTGKSVSINSILVSLLNKCSPDNLGLILIDPKILELSVYEDIPHLRVPVVTESKRVKAVLNWAVKEMDKRYRLMQRFGVRNIDSYNNLVLGTVRTEAPDVSVETDTKLSSVDGDAQENSDEDIALPIERLQTLPKVVIVIDELADLMMQVGREIEELITRLAQKARAAGIHLIVATQRPSVDVITGLIKANFPARMSFRVSSRVDSRTILDSMGAERLLGKGDMLLRTPGAGPLQRVHGAFVADEDVNKFISELKQLNGPPRYDERIIAMCEKAEKEEEEGEGSFGGEDLDLFYDQAVALVLAKGQASTSMIQRQFRIGYNRAARIIEQMEREGIVGPMDGAKAREVLVGTAGADE